MKVLLTAVNAKYIHSNLALYTLQAYASKYKENVELAEFTINQYADEILQQIYKKTPDVIAFSCYIWNIKIIESISCEVRKILPHTKIWLGGPEVSYDAEEIMGRLTYIDGIMIGEGEATFLELVEYYTEGKHTLDDIKGIVFQSSACITPAEVNAHVSFANPMIATPPRGQLDLSTIPFPYKNIEEFKNRIIYYETSRGCPYSCSYCLSSIDKRVRFRNIELVKQELQCFLEQKIPQVKFVDRTFNCNKNHAMEIWTYLKNHDNGITNFHFEISADILDREELELLASFRPGLAQLEIGIQSTNPTTIAAVNRKMNFEKLQYAVHKLNEAENIHQHLDLIAGLPFEDYGTFQKSFNAVYALRPEQFQLGFLKVLKGSAMYEESKKSTIIYKSTPPYEVLYTKWLKYEEILHLKAVEEMIEVYYNSGQFENTVEYLLHFHKTPFDMYHGLSNYYERKHLNGISQSRISRYHILLEYYQEVIKEEEDAIKNILVYDLYLRENLKSRPFFASDNSIYKERYRKFYMEKENQKKYLGTHAGTQQKQTGSLTHIEYFGIDIEKTVLQGKTYKKDCFVLFDYQKRNPLNYEAATFHLDNI